MTAVRRAAGFAPVSAALLAVTWVLRWTAGPGADELRARLGVDMPWRVTDWHLLTSGWTSPTLPGALLATAGIVALAVPSERVLGSVRFAGVVAAAQVFAVPVGLLAARVVEEMGLRRWGGDLMAQTFLSPMAWVFGAAAFATAAMRTLWRRRVRLFLAAVSVTLVLFTGTLADVVALAATAVGAIAGALVIGRGDRPLLQKASVRESRILVAVLMASVASGPVLAGADPRADGPFAAATRFLWAPAVEQSRVMAECLAHPSSQACADGHLLLRQSGVGPMMANLMPVVVALVIAFGLASGRRLAWWLAVAAQVASAAIVVAQLLRHTSGAAGAGAWAKAAADASFAVPALAVVLPWLVTLGALLATRRLFDVRVDGRTAGRTAAAIAATVAAASAAWLAGAVAMARSFHPEASFAHALAELPYRFLPPALAELWPRHLLPHSTASWALYEWVGVATWIVAAALLFRLFASVPDRSHAHERERAEAILRGGSGDHLSWMTLWDGNRYWFDEAPEGGSGDGSRDTARGYVAYRVHGGVALTLGEPVVAGTGDGADGGEGGVVTHPAAGIADRFEEFAASRGWHPAWYSVREPFARDRARREFLRVHVAEEAVLDAAQAEFKGKRFQNIRTARNRAKKEGIEAIWTTWDELSPALHQQIFALSEDWVADKALPEMGFTLGTVDELPVPGTRLLLAVDGDGRLHGITSWLPVYQDGAVAGYTLDVMRRDADGFRPVIEFLLAEALAIAAADGLGWVSLSGAPLAAPEGAGASADGAAEGSRLLGVLLDKVGETMEPLYGFRSLAASKHKFRPAHEGWYLCYRDELALPAIGVAVSTAYLPHLGARDAASAMRTWLAARERE